jgi:hypothetical protein
MGELTSLSRNCPENGSTSSQALNQIHPGLADSGASLNEGEGLILNQSFWF